MDKKVIDALSETLDFRHDENAPHTLVRGEFNTVAEESAIVDSFALLVNPAFAEKLAALSRAMQEAGMENSALPYIPLRAQNLGGLSLYGVEGGDAPRLDARQETPSGLAAMLDEAEKSDLMISGIAEVQVTSRDIILQVMGNEEGMCEAVFGRDEFLRIVNSPFEKQKNSPKP